MCNVCRHPDRIAIEAALRTGRPLRSLAADYPGLNKSSLGRHRKDCMGAPTGAPVATGCTPTPEAAPQNSPTIRHRTRAQTDDESRLRTVMLLRAEGRTYVEIARRLNIHPSTVREDISRANAKAIERVRSQTVEKLVAQHMVAQQARARNLARLQEQAEARNDVRTQLDIAKIRQAEERLQMDWMDKLGAFDHFRLPTEDDRRHGSARSGGDLIDMFRDVFSSAMLTGEDQQEGHIPTETTH